MRPGAGLPDPASDERVEALDTWLWTYRDESFLAHGTARDGSSGRFDLRFAVGMSAQARARRLAGMVRSACGGGDWAHPIGGCGKLGRILARPG